MRFFNRYIMYSVATLAAIIMATTLFFIRQESTTGRQSDLLIIGTATGYAPFVSINQNGEYEGFDIDVAKQLAQQMHRTLILKDLGSMSALFMALNNGSIDAIIWGLSITAQRKNHVEMIHYHGDAVHSYPLLFWKNVPPSVRSLHDMRGKTICVEPGSSQEAVLQKYPEIQALFIEKVDDLLLHLQYGTADAALVESAIAKKFQKKISDLKMITIDLAPEDFVQGVGITVSKTNQKLTDQLQAAVAQLKSRGIIASLEQKWDLS